MTFRLFVLATFLGCALSLICPVVAGAQAGSATATTSILHPNGPEAFSHVAPLTLEEHEMLDEKLEKLHEVMVQKKGTVPLGPQVPVPTNNRETKPATAITDVEGPNPTPSAFYIGIKKPYSIVGDGESTTAEPSIAQSGENWVVTQNWSRGYTNNHGLNFTKIADDSGPSDAPFFCCDQDAVHDHGRDVSIWSELFTDSALTTGVIRLHVRAANNLSDACTYDLNGGAGVLFDYPHLGLGNNFIYIVGAARLCGAITSTNWRPARVLAGVCSLGRGASARWFGLQLELQPTLCIW
jgi:hypothetical protein